MTAAAISRSATSAATHLSARIREAAAGGEQLRIIGGGSWLDANRPVRASSRLTVGEHIGIVEYEPGDLTITALAGTTLDEITRATAAHGQWLTLDPFGNPARATIGATIATASYGALAHHFGTPRDVTLGVEFVSGTGDIVRGGGRVVKNVAGFDLTRLVTGSWGTVGALTEATLRLRALPTTQSTLALGVTGDTDVERVRAAVRRLPFVPMAAQLLDATLASTLGVSKRGAALIVRLGGNEDALRAQCAEVSAIAPASEVGIEVWRRLQTSEPPRAATLRLSRLPSMFTATWRDSVHIAERWPGSFCHGDPGRGVCRIVLPLSDDTNHASVRAILDVPFDGGRIYERLPASLWSSLAPSAMRGPLDRGVKAAFDPQNLLNPGIFGELQ